MAWIKRNLLFVISSVITLGLLGAAGFYDYKSWARNAAAFEQLNEIYGDLRSIGSQKLGPGNDKVNNIETAREQEHEIRAWIKKAREHFQLIDPIPSPTNGPVSSET